MRKKMLDKNLKAWPQNDALQKSVFVPAYRQSRLRKKHNFCTVRVLVRSCRCKLYLFPDLPHYPIIPCGGCDGDALL